MAGGRHLHHNPEHIGLFTELVFASPCSVGWTSGWTTLHQPLCGEDNVDVWTTLHQPLCGENNVDVWTTLHQPLCGEDFVWMDDSSPAPTEHTGLFLFFTLFWAMGSASASSHHHGDLKQAVAPLCGGMILGQLVYLSY